MKITVAKYYTPSGRCIQAIDYSHRNADGSVGKIPDSLKVAFKTAAGRTVLDGGGITPDLEVQPEYFSSLSINLITRGAIFNFANNYYYTHPDAPDMNNFVVSDEVYTDFIKSLDDVKLTYDSELENAVTEFEAAAKQSMQYEALKNDIEDLKKEVLHDQAADLISYKEEVSDLIAEQIVARYYLTKGEIANAITHDPDVTRAIEVLNNPEEYHQLLSKK